MRRRITAALATVGIALTFPLILIPPAQAANLGTITWNGTTLTPSSLNAQAGDTFTLQNTANYDVVLVGNLRDSGLLTCSGRPRCQVMMTTGSGVFTVLGVGEVQIFNDFTRSVVTSFFTNGTGGSGSALFTSSATPTPVIQQFGKPISGACDSSAPASLDWADVASGGWSESWAQWVNGGRGGAVCTRTLTYSNALRSWTTG